MTDRLTQLQDCLDDLLTQMYASLNYVFQRHPYGDIPGQTSRAPETSTSDSINSIPGSSTKNDGETAANAMSPNNGGDRNGLRDEATPPPDLPETFHATLRELAQDLILKEQQIEHLINSLPGIGNSEADQEARMRELELELKQVEEERSRKEIERQALVDILGDIIGHVKRVP